jgi:nucleoside-diphosphate kinase
MGPPQRLAFMTQWLDPLSNVTWTYQLMVFPQSEEVELFDVKNRRTFLKRTKLEGLKTELFFVGSKVTIFGRQLDIVDYGDAFTQRTLADAKQRNVYSNIS